MIGVDCQDLPIGLFRSRQPPRLVVLYRYLQSVGNRRHERCDSEARITLSVDTTQKDAWRLDTSSNTQASRQNTAPAGYEVSNYGILWPHLRLRGRFRANSSSAWSVPSCRIRWGQALPFASSAEQSIGPRRKSKPSSRTIAGPADPRRRQRGEFDMQRTGHAETLRREEAKGKA